jgi:renalase
MTSVLPGAPDRAALAAFCPLSYTGVMDEMADLIVVGAGIAGLSCARAAADMGRSVLLLERSHSPGGRCASKSPGGSFPPADFGPTFVNGDDPDFLRWIETFGSDLIPGWPFVVEGSGSPCQPAAFEPGQRRFALKPGLRWLADSLARNLNVSYGTEVAAFSWESAGFTVTAADGRRFRARDLALALALQQSRALLGAEAAIDALLASFSTLPCLTLIAGYGPGTPTPEWGLRFPGESRSIFLVSNEGPKRGLPPERGALLTIQARPSWSAARFEEDRSDWTRELLDEAAALLGAWAASPAALTSHRWRYARLAPWDHLASPALFDRPDSTARLGLAGDLFDQRGGIQGAWLAGRKLAARFYAGLGPKAGPD